MPKQLTKKQQMLIKQNQIYGGGKNIPGMINKKALRLDN